MPSNSDGFCGRLGGYTRSAETQCSTTGNSFIGKRTTGRWDGFGAVPRHPASGSSRTVTSVFGLGRRDWYAGQCIKASQLFIIQLYTALPGLQNSLWDSWHRVPFFKRMLEQFQSHWYFRRYRGDTFWRQKVGVRGIFRSFSPIRPHTIRPVRFAAFLRFSSPAHGLFQRVVSVVLALFLLPLLLPLSNASDATLPACCRRDGKHHCAMSDRSRPPGPKGLPGASCPHRTTFLSVSLAFVDAAVFPRALRTIRAAFLLSRRLLSRSSGSDSRQEAAMFAKLCARVNP